MAACRAVSAVFPIVIVPFIIAKLGIIGYGTWEALLSAATFCAFGQSATVNTMLWQMSNAYGSLDEERIRRLLQIGVFITLVQFLIIFPLVWIFRFQLTQLFNVPKAMITVASIVLPIFGGMMVLNIINECVGAIISGYQRTGVVSIIQTISQAVNYLVSIGGLYAGFGLLSLFIGYTVGIFTTSIANLIIANRLCPHLRLSPVLPTRQECQELWRYFSLMLVGSISAVLRDQKDKLLLTTFWSPVWTGYYSIASRLTGFISIMNSFFYVPALTAAGALNARRNWEGIKRIYSDIVSILVVLVGFMAVVIAGLHNRIVVLWIGNSLPEVGNIITWLVIGNVTAIILTGPGGAICKGIGRIGIEASYWAIGIIINVFLTVVLVIIYNEMGTIAASALSWAISSIAFLFILHNKLDLPKRVSWRAIKSLVAIIGTVIIIRNLSALWPYVGTRTGVAFSIATMMICAFPVFIFLLWAVKAIPLSSEIFVKSFRMITGKR